MDDPFDDIVGTIPQLPPPQAGAPPPQGTGAVQSGNVVPPGAVAVPTIPSVMGRDPGLTGPYQGGLGAQWDFIEPTDTSSGSAVRSAGLTALAAATGLGVGIAAGGAWGGIAGATLVGAGANIYRAQKLWASDDPSEKHEAVVSAVFGALELALGAFAGYKAYESRTPTTTSSLTPNAEDSGDGDEGDDE